MKSLQSPWQLQLIQPAAIAVAVYVAHIQMGHTQEAVDHGHHPASEVVLPGVTVSATGLGWAAQDMAAPVSVLEGQTWQLQRAAT